MIFQMFPMSMHVFEPLSLLNNDPFPVMLEDADNSHVFAKENKEIYLLKVDGAPKLCF